MPKAINPTIASCPCSIKGCECVADVRQEKGHERGALYLVCPEHGRVSVNGAKFKAKMAEYIQANMYTEEPEPPEPVAEPVAEPAPEQVPEKPEPTPEPEKTQVTVKPEKGPKKSGGFIENVSAGAEELEEWMK